MIKKLLLGLLKAFAFIVLCVLLFFGAMVGYSLYADKRAEKAVKEFCGSVRVGSDIDSVIAAAANYDVESRHRFYESRQEHLFIFQASIFNSQDCIVTISGNKVVSTRIEKNDND